ncbi:zinc metalloproteinase nas-4-like [Hydractinia symbiolongicarpus]|uniref:zinc metalloproteinase nas-4-like n=1 Tax=Hydractinia symbiolongicarpus TaxID=13093 RepID=UPI00254A2F2B|nr:zinc metalloproteinase nas-4-like [Hydractinia symbiolongicarpus]
MEVYSIFFFVALTFVNVVLANRRMSTTDEIDSINKHAGIHMELMDEKTDETRLGNHDANHKIGHAFLKRSFDIRWPNRVVPYVIDSAFRSRNIKDPLLKYATAYIKGAMKTLETLTCVRFREYKLENAPKHFVHIINGEGCWSYVGRKRRGSQRLSLKIGSSVETCLRQPIILHELLHVLGFIHEQCRTDRDSFVQVYQENIEAGRSKEFGIELSSRNVVQEYDPLSVLHYSNKAFSKNGKQTLIWKKNPNKPLGGIQISKLDIKKINAVYCQNPSTARPAVTTTSPAHTVVTTRIPKTKRKKTTPVKTSKPKKWWPAACKDRLRYCRHLIVFRGYCKLYGYRCPKTCGLC